MINNNLDNNSDMYFVTQAIKEAIKAYNKREIPVGAVIVKDGKIIARGHNVKETKKNPLGHAEIVCINKAAKKLDAWRLNDLTMYVTLEPCTMCAGAIVHSRIKKVVYCLKDEKTGALGSKLNINDLNLNHKIEIEQYTELNDKLSKFMKKFFKEMRNGKQKI